jgi:GMP synthase-like glutamine amidotransferase
MAAGRRRGLILQHGDDAPPAILGEWARSRGLDHEVHSTWRDPLPSDPGEYAWIAALGSEQTPGSASAPAWVDVEIDFLRRGLERGVPVLGLCFGGQALAVAAGGSVASSEPPEVGWAPIETSAPELIPPGPWLHYHYDLLVPPARAEVLARSPAGPAAFVVGRSLGLQFHPESTPELAAEWARQDAERLARIGVDPAVLREQGERAGEGARAAALRLFDAWWGRADAHGEDGMGTLSKIEEPEPGSSTDRRRST